MNENLERMHNAYIAIQCLQLHLDETLVAHTWFHPHFSEGNLESVGSLQMGLQSASYYTPTNTIVMEIQSADQSMELTLNKSMMQDTCGLLQLKKRVGGAEKATLETGHYKIQSTHVIECISDQTAAIHDVIG
jgi:hypothetical protein